MFCSSSWDLTQLANTTNLHVSSLLRSSTGHQLASVVIVGGADSTIAKFEHGHNPRNTNVR